MSELKYPIPADDMGSLPAKVHEEVMDLAVIGAGMAGLAASVFAVDKGLSTARLGSTGGIAYTTGYFDFLGAPGDACEPWAADAEKAFVALRNANPEHPYAKIDREDIDAAMKHFMDLLAASGLPYVAVGGVMLGLSPLGTVKGTHAVPATMAPGVEAFKKRTPCLLVDFIGLKAFSAKGIAAALNDSWPDIASLSIEFPGLQWAGELYPEAMARSLEAPANREALAALIKPNLGGAQCVGMPAVLGIYNSAAVHKHMEELLGVPVFEIPTLPPAVPGIRLRETLDEAMRGKNMTLFAQRQAFAVRKENGLFLIDVGETKPEFTLRARNVLLATGRFLSGGLVACREKGVVEPLMNLPLAAPADRDMWHKEDIFDPAGHGINKAGVRVDNDFRPVDANGVVFDEALYAAGSILAGQDWIREKSGAGISLASAWKAVNAIARRKKESI